MKTRFFNWFLVAAAASAVTAACADDDHVTDGTGGAHQGGKANTGGSGARGGAPSTGGTAVAGESGAPTSNGGSAGAPEGGAAGTPASGGTSPGAGGRPPGSGGVAPGNGGSTPGSGGVLVGAGGTSPTQGGSGGKSTGGTANAEGGVGGGSDFAGAGGQGGEAGAPVDPVVQRGQYLVVNVAQCGGCHTAPNSAQLSGNPNFRFNSVLVPAPNLTSDPTGLGEWTDEEIKHAVRDGIDDQGRQLSPGMPYWLYHNLTDADADAIVAYLRSVPKVQNIVGDSNAAATPVAPLPPSAFPNTSLTSGAEFDSAVQGKYLLTSAARCVSCHSVLTKGIPAPAFSGRAASTAGGVYPANLTPDATGIAGWTASDVATVLLNHTAKGTTIPICGMPRYTGLSAADALAIGNYLTTIPGVQNTSASLPDLPACP